MTTPSKIEKQIEPILIHYFPLYIEFREKFLVPLTEHPQRFIWRNDILPELEEVGIASYGIAKSICFINNTKDHIDISDENQSFKNIYFHFGLIFDSTEFLARSIIKTKQVLGLLNIDDLLKIPKRELIDQFIYWIENSYEKSFNDFRDRGKPIFYYPQKNKMNLSLIIKNPTKREYFTFETRLKNYRNFFTHNPGVDVFKNTMNNSLFTIKKEFVEKNKNWSNLSLLYFEKNANFINPKEMVENDLISLLKILNKVWASILTEMETIFKHPDFNIIFRNYRRDET